MVGGGPGSLHRVPTGRSGWLLLPEAVRDPASSGAAPGGSTCHLPPRKDVPVTSGRWETILDGGNHGLLPHRRARPGHVCSCTASGMCRRHKARLLCRRSVASFPGPRGHSPAREKAARVTQGKQGSGKGLAHLSCAGIAVRVLPRAAALPSGTTCGCCRTFALFSRAAPKSFKKRHHCGCGAAPCCSRLCRLSVPAAERDVVFDASQEFDCGHKAEVTQNCQAAAVTEKTGADHIPCPTDPLRLTGTARR